MARLQEIVSYTNDLLRVDEFRDYCPNGLQVEGKSVVNHIVMGVTASQALLDQAIAQQADAILVHHGYFWKGEHEAITGIKKKRLQALLQQDINLLAYHLPLDTHRDLGNNAQLAQVLGLTDVSCIEQGKMKGLLWQGRLEPALTPASLSRHLNDCLQHQPLFLDGGHQGEIATIAWCTGAAQGYIEAAAELGVDAYISGEISEQTTHQSRELGVHYFAAGHHATERYGVQALGKHLAEKFQLSCEFIDCPNPV